MFFGLPLMSFVKGFHNATKAPKKYKTKFWWMAIAKLHDHEIIFLYTEKHKECYPIPPNFPFFISRHRRNEYKNKSSGTMNSGICKS